MALSTEDFEKIDELLSLLEGRLTAKFVTKADLERFATKADLDRMESRLTRLEQARP